MSRDCWAALPSVSEPSLMLKWLFHILIFATNIGSGKYQNKEKRLKRQRKLGLFLAVPRGCLRFVIVVFPDHTHLLFYLKVKLDMLCLLNSLRIQHFWSVYFYRLYLESQTDWLKTDFSQGSQTGFGSLGRNILRQGNHVFGNLACF